MISPLCITEGILVNGYTDRKKPRALVILRDRSGMVSSAIVKHKVVKLDGGVYCKSIPFGPAIVRTVRFEADAWLERTVRHIQDDRCDDYCLVFVRKGGLRAVFGSSALTATAGQCVLVDLAEPTRTRIARGTEATTLRFPRRWLGSRVAGIERALMRVFDTWSGWHAALGAVMSGAVQERDGGGLYGPTAFVEQIARTVALMAEVGGASIGTAQEATLRRLRRDLRACLGDSELGLASFAKRHGMSTRTLQGLFQAGGSSFSATLTRLRLERAAEMLADPDFDGLSVAEIAFNVGFVNASHFGRRFREAYGVSPRQHRERRGPWPSRAECRAED
jgi:AraC family transcriptional regulator, positive regulator of tynA and feaB